MGPGKDVVSGDEGGRGGRDFARGEALCFLRLFSHPFLDEMARSYADPVQLHLHCLQLPTQSRSGRSFAIPGHVL